MNRGVFACGEAGSRLRLGPVAGLVDGGSGAVGLFGGC